MIKILCDDVLVGTNRKRVIFYEDDSDEAIMTDGVVYESELEASEREALELLILEGLDDDD